MKNKTCFVIMPISDTPGYETNHWNVVYEHIIKPACQAAGFEPMRADEVKETNYIAVDILRRIVEADMAICDISSKNPNVMYELGLRHAIKKPVTLLKDNKTEEVFDIQGLRRIDYDVSLRIDIVKKAVADLKSSIDETYIKRGESVNSLMDLIARREPNEIDEITLKVIEKTSPFSSKSEFIAGEVHHWDESRSIGALHDSDGISYYFNLHLIVHKESLSVGEKVYFIPTLPPGEGKNPFANCVLAIGRQANGVVRSVNSDRGFAFADISDSRGKGSSIYVALNTEQTIIEGAIITFKISENSLGVCGINPISKD